jgi:hypothetical protein
MLADNGAVLSYSRRLEAEIRGAMRQPNGGALKAMSESDRQ